MTRAEVQQRIDAQPTRLARERETNRIAAQIEMTKYRRKYLPLALEKARLKLATLELEAARLGLAL